MSEPAEKQLPRPRQVTMAGWMIILASVAVVLTVFQQVSGLHSLETTETLERALSEPPVSDLGVSVEGARNALRIFAMIAGACATAAAILGYQVLQRSRPARLALAVLVVPLFVTGITSGGLLSSVVVAAALMLWLQPARDWFDGKAPATPEAAAIAHGPRAAAPSRPVWPPPLPPQDPQAQPHGQPQGQVPLEAARQASAPQQRSTTRAAAPATARPPSLVAAVVLTWVGSGLATLLAVASGIGIALDPGAIDDVLADNPDAVEQGVTTDLALAVVITMLAVFVLWCVVAAVLAALVWRGVEWAHLLLVISASVAVAVCAVGLLASTAMLLPLAMVVSALVLLVRPDSRAWLRAHVR